MPRDNQIAIEEMQKVINQMADRLEGEENFDFEKARYKVSLQQMSKESELSFLAYLLLKYCWNDALDWAKEPNAYVKG